MSLNITINLQSVLEYVGRAYNDETGAPSIVYTSTLSTGPVYDVSLARNLVTSYTTGGNPVSGSDYDILNSFATNLRSLETETTSIYSTLKNSFLAAEFNKLNNFFTSAYNTDIRTYLNSGSYSTTSGPVSDIHGGFAQSYLDYNGLSLVFKVAEIVCSGSYVYLIPSPLAYPGVNGLTRIDISTVSGSVANITDENINTALVSGPYNSIVEFAHSGSANVAYIVGSNAACKTLVYPRISNSGYSASSFSGIGFSGSYVEMSKQPMFRNPQAPNTLILKAVNVNDDGDRDFVFNMVNSSTSKATLSDVEQTQIITVANSGSMATIIGTNGNTSYYRPFSIVNATNTQNGELFEIWVAQ